MNAEEALLVLRKVKAYRPAQAIDEYTADAWEEAFDDIRYPDALLAVRNLGRASSSYLDPANIRSEVARINAERIAEAEKCYICGGLLGQCLGHDFETAEEARRNAVPKPANMR